ncbi:hypothetical protein DPM19_09185 [Actinomadura craniellae]|uniref:Uncharacterized protein n=1 Tax=Actinomadura craniellae TaxID=2231787 RepID=A0A365H9Z6_9ACTN|nr:hypothetical protein [Actinomadura craniellae]RAY15917.1 hypothetical protein DPM19_09185 [Actinomadura craniellae]
MNPYQDPNHPPPPGSYPLPPPDVQRRHAGCAVAVAVVLFVLITGAVVIVAALLFLRSDPDEPAATGPPAAVSTPPSASAPSSVALAGRWEGNYECNQGTTGMRLTLTDPRPDGTLTATFDFFSVPGNRSVPTGSFVMLGTYREGALSLRGDRWINRPDGYLMINLNAQIREDRPTNISGTVDGTGCHTFSVNRVSG